ncbi:MAG: class I SAM-dependent methyltransferase [Pseudomonadales bacterium]|nr:class I SAM-dependent methyltransferase [Pseudomonadales bacterium]MDG2079433.1 class I SAM-dependent methyltransferase [Pseudomonadales bacterium]
MQKEAAEVMLMPELMSGFSAFLDSDIGAAMLALERAEIQQLLPQLVGYNCLQLSVQKNGLLCEESKFGQLIKVGYAPVSRRQMPTSARNEDVCANYESLPVASDCVDVVLLHHVLEFASEPHQLLREATRTLTAGGYLLITGFNPMSAWPAYQRYYTWKQRSAGIDASATKRLNKNAALLKPIRQGRLEDWLSLLNYDVLQQKQFFYRPPINSERWLNRLQFFEDWGEVMHLPIGLGYITLARKRTLTATPIMSSWRQSLRSSRRAGAHAKQPHKRSS